MADTSSSTNRIASNNANIEKIAGLPNSAATEADRGVSHVEDCDYSPGLNKSSDCEQSIANAPIDCGVISKDPPGARESPLAEPCSAPEKPKLVIDGSDPMKTVEALRDLLTDSGKFFDRGGPAQVINDDMPLVQSLTKDQLIMATHRLCQPVKVDNKGRNTPTTLPDRIAKMYLKMDGSWNLPKLAGVSTSPLLSGDGAIRLGHGYDSASGLWCCNIPKLEIPSLPSQREAESALLVLRQTFRTFPFADATRQRDGELEVVDMSTMPGQDESAFLLSLLTAVCRASLPLAPGFLVTAPAMSGAGSGKGLLVRAVCLIAFGSPPHPFTNDGERKEFDKCLTAELIDGQPAVFLDNANGLVLESALLASVMTELPVKVRRLGRATMVPLNSTAFIVITGNGLTVAEDLARRFMLCKLDPRCEHPEQRPFLPGFLRGIEARRAELLAAALTIWRFGRQNAKALPRGKPLGSYETWTEWCRDPLLAIGCRDPVERIEEIKASDPARQIIVDLFHSWWEHHGSTPITVKNLAKPVQAIANPQKRPRQWLATYVAGLAGTHAAGFVLSRQDAAGKWSAASYALTKS